MLAFIDTETTGFLNADHVIEVAAVVVSPDCRRLYTTYDSVLPPHDDDNGQCRQALLRQWASDNACHGLQPDTFSEIVRHASPKARQRVLESLIATLSQCHTIVGHNLDFDLRMLANTGGAAGQWFKDLKDGRMPRFRLVDTLQRRSAINGKAESLQSLYQRLGSGRLDAYQHSALGDCLRLYEIFTFLPTASLISQEINEDATFGINTAFSRFDDLTKHNMLKDLGFILISR